MKLLFNSSARVWALGMYGVCAKKKEGEDIVLITYENMYLVWLGLLVRTHCPLKTDKRKKKNQKKFF